MKRHRIVKILGSLVAIFLAGAVFLYWQVSRMKFSFNDEQVEKAQTLAVGAMSDIALDRSVLGGSFSTEEASKPLLDQYRDNPALFKQRAMFTRTWLIAGRLAQDITQHGYFPHTIISSSDLAEVALSNRVDAWNNPYCVLVKNGAIVVMSSGDKGPLQCKPLQVTGEDLSNSANSVQLKRLPNDVLVTVLHVSSFRDLAPAPPYRPPTTSSNK
jgi:hypothetical protein